jgi:hypothetical protein
MVNALRATPLIALNTGPCAMPTVRSAVFLPAAEETVMTTRRWSACHGPAATGTERGPDLLPRVREMGARRFVNVVLYRYDWSLPAARAGSESAAREALIDEVMRRQQGDLAMPAWQGEPRVNAHITDLYAYLSARAEGTQGPGRPTP